jgi:hypothetical protein
LACAIQATRDGSQQIDHDGTGFSRRCAVQVSHDDPGAIAEDIEYIGQAGEILIQPEERIGPCIRGHGVFHWLRSESGGKPMTMIGTAMGIGDV